MKEAMIKSYVKEMFDMMKLRFPDIDENILKKFILKITKEKIEESKNTNEFKITYERHGIAIPKDMRSELTLNQLDVYLKNKKPIITGYGCFYKRHDEYYNILGEMVRQLKALRKNYKNLMFEHINDDDQSLKEMYDSRQKTIKILNNSFYGATAEANSIFYHPHFGPSITYTGEDLVTTAAKAFENFLGNNLQFENVNDVMIYIFNICKEDYKIEVKFNKQISKNELINYLKKNTLNKDNFEIIEDLFDSFENNYDKDFNNLVINMIYYKNNFYEFLNNTNICYELFKDIVGRKDFLDPNKPPKDMVETLDKIWNILSDYVFYNHQDFYRFDRIANKKRKSILTIDTDSNFLYLYPYFEYFENKFPNIINGKDKESVTCNINIAMYNLTKLIDRVMNNITGEWNIPDEFHHIINMKNEFLISRILLTHNKKNYASIVLMQEGNILNNPKADIKGLPIRKVNTNRHVREYFTQLLEEEILTPDKINLSSVIYKYKIFEKNIYDSLKSGNLEFSIPGRVNEELTYKYPERIMSFRGAVIWNIMFPDQEINLPEKVNMVKLNIDSFDAIQKYYKDPKIRDIFKKVFIYKNGKYTSKGIDVISIPKSIKQLPEILIPFINLDDMVNTNISPAIGILESLGFNTLDILTSQFTTNVIRL